MTDIDQVRAFARDFVNGTSRTQEQKNLIRRVYREITGEQLRSGCSTCLIEAIFTIIKSKPTNTMTSKYQLKPGALLQAFGDETKICTWKTLTNELAEYHLTTNPGCIKFFTEASQELWRRKLEAMKGEPAELEIVPVHADKDPEKPTKKPVTRKPRKAKK